MKIVWPVVLGYVIAMIIEWFTKPERTTTWFISQLVGLALLLLLLFFFRKKTNSQGE